jgi:ribosomal protein S18 acetylase RimI-like enzyme
MLRHTFLLVLGECAALYVYELQVDQAHGRKGIGKRLMQLMELIARKQAMQWLMLTVIKANTNAMAFYQKMKYTVDDTSPSMCYEDADECYEILSKCICPEERKIQAERKKAETSGKENTSAQKVTAAIAAQ